MNLKKFCICVALLASVLVIDGGALIANAQSIAYSGTVVDLQGNARVGTDVAVSVFFLNDGRLINAFDSSNPDIVAGKKLRYDASTAQFFLPIRVADLPTGDVSIRLRFAIRGQIISEVDWLTGKKSLALDVVVPDPKPVTCSCSRPVRRRLFCR